MKSAQEAVFPKKVYTKPMLKKIVIALSVAAVVFPLFAFAQATLVPDATTTSRAKVISVASATAEDVPDLAIKATSQTLDAEILDGPEAGKRVSVENDYVMLKPGNSFYITHTVNSLDGTDYYTMQDPSRMTALYILCALFILLVCIFGGKQGVRGLMSLAGSFVLIFFVLMPSIVHGFSPVLAAIGVSSLIIVIGSYVTHGFNRTTSAAVIGMIATVAVTGVLALVFVHAAKLTGFTSDESISLNWNTGGSINFVSLLLGGIMIGLLGVLYDMAIGQAIAVEELRNIGPHVPAATIWKRAVRIGREHIGALVNTLVIAYVGASLPLILLVYTTVHGSTGAHEPIINQEIFATEIVRSLIGAIGIVLAMPVTTLVATFMLAKKNSRGSASEEELHKQESAVAHFHHSH